MTAMMKDNNMNKRQLDMELLENVSGGTPKSIPGGKRSGRKNSETALEISQLLGNLGSGIQIGRATRLNSSHTDSSRMPSSA